MNSVFRLTILEEMSENIENGLNQIPVWIWEAPNQLLDDGRSVLRLVNFPALYFVD